MQVHLHKGKGGGEGSSTGACRYVDLIGKLQEIIYTSPLVQTQQNLFLLSFGKSFAPLGIMQYICATGNLHHGRMAQWSAAWQHSADALKFKSLSMQIILDQMGLNGIGLDWIGLSKCI
jgi:hypothetical protein